MLHVFVYPSLDTKELMIEGFIMSSLGLSNRGVLTYVGSCKTESTKNQLSFLMKPGPMAKIWPGLKKTL